MAKRDIYAEVTDSIVALLENVDPKNYVAPFAQVGAGMPVNVSSGKLYQGINIILLWSQQKPSDTWGTYKQWEAKGRQVSKGQKATRIIFFKPLEVTDKKTGEEKKIPMLRAFSVFNESQLDDYSPEEITDAEGDAARVERLDAFVAATGATIKEGTKACYNQLTDHIEMPQLAAFRETTVSATDNYYSTVFHELTHWTGAKSRLDRLQDRSQEGYAMEELVAEMGAAFLCASLGVAQGSREDHAMYIASWLKALKNDKKLVVKAAAAAQKAANLLHDSEAA